MKIKMYRKRILIVGDSWGEGHSYGLQHNGNQHNGLADILNKEFDVTNLSRGGGNNLTSYKNLENNHKDFDFKIFIFTEPSRDIDSPHDFNITLDYDIEHTLFDQLERSTTKIINDTHKLCGATTFLIGGLFKINTLLDFKGTINWHDIITPKLSLWPTLWVNPHSFYRYYEKNKDKVPKKEIIDLEEWQIKFEHKYQTMIANTPKHFFNEHPSIKSHYILADLITKVIKNK